MPLLLLTGTLGAVIRIREPIPNKRALFDIGAAGPFAGFLLAVPALFLGVAMSHIAKLPPNFVGFNLGEPLLFKIASRIIWGPIPDGYSINLHPMAFAAWFALLATAMNLLPFGQLDGGHIAYAVFGRRSAAISIGTLIVAAALAFWAQFWIVWTIVMLTMTLWMGPHHPRTVDEDDPLDRTRLWLAVAAAVVLVLCFTYAPIEPTELLK
jgi:membrane-associated protease RseP (regulator of RpoE activity)